MVSKAEKFGGALGKAVRRTAARAMEEKKPPERAIMKIDGGCHCGNIRYEAEVDPGTASMCHCTDCQMLSGGAFRAIVQATSATFKMTGTPTIYLKTGDSGNVREQAFCPRCGSSIYSTAPGAGPKIYSIRLGTARQRAQLKPSRQIWTRSHLPWVFDIEAIPQIEKQ
jgi:hypothetical protein